MADSIDRFFSEWQTQDLELPQLAPEIQYLYRIARVSKLLGARLDATCTAYGLTRSQFEALAALRRGHPRPLSAQELMDASLLTSGSVTAMINQLLKAGLVMRKTSVEDKRRLEIQLTVEGRTLIEAALRERVEDNARLARLLKPADRKEMNRLMRIFVAALEALPEAHRV